MTRAMRSLVLAFVVAPFLVFGVYRLARGLGFLDAPWNPEHGERRTIVAAIYALLLFLCIFLFGYANAWPRVWAIFGIVNAAALVFFLVLGVGAARRLWKMRHPAPDVAAAPGAETPDKAGENPLL
jgi:Flp pilus assembly protein TadB